MTAVNPHCHTGMARFYRRIRYTILLLALVFILYSSPVFSDGGDAAGTEEVSGEATSASSTAAAPGAPSDNVADAAVDGAGASAGEKPKETTPKKKPNKPKPTGNEDWGTFYDPNKIFCGKFDCYKILGFDYATWGVKPPSLKEITKSYRALSRVWHPDKNKAKGAKQKFVAIAKAYEVLTNVEKRAEYDHFRDRPDEYFKKYGSSVLWSYAPQSDVSFIIILFFVLGSAFTYYAQKSKWETIAKHLVKAAVEDLSPRDGGSTESIDIRERALDILAKRKAEGELAEKANGESKKKAKGPKVTAREKREKEQDELRPICVQLVEEIDDFGGGFRKATMQDLLVLKMVKWPYYLTKSILWWSKYAFRRLKKLELNDEEREVLTKNVVGDVTWAAVSEEERAEMVTLDLWVTDNLVDWRDKQDLKQAKLSANRERRVKRMMKKGGDKMD